MSDTLDDNKEKKLTLSPRNTLGVGGGVETGKVRQSFSHGRSKTVTVERKKRRIVKRGPGDGPSDAVGAAAITIKKKISMSDGDAQTSGSAEVGLTHSEQDVRAAAFRKAAEEQRIIDEERKRKAEESAQRQRDAVAASEEEKKAVAEEDARRQAEDAAKRHAEEDAQKIADEDAAKQVLEAQRQADLEQAAQQREQKLREQEELRKEAETRRKQSKRGKGGDRRRSGKLTVSMALDGREGSRPRSLAAYKRAQAKKKHQAHAGEAQAPQSREITVPESITVQELANRMAEKAVAVIKVLMGMDVMVTINESLDQDTAELVVAEFGHVIKRVSESDVEIGLIGEDDADEDKLPRPAVVTVMGHVDHGKTSLLDALRKTDVVTGEAGGITQHIGAYQVTLDSGEKITFLDTPGHAAFTEMRARGARVTDVVILVVAADDGIMPQTIEAINHAKAAGVPIIVAINKMDREGADPDKVRQGLLQHEIIVEAMSGDVLDVEVSALKGTGLDKLTETLALQAELLELRANPNRSAEGVVIEAKLDKGRGSVATILVQRGTLRVGDIFVAGAEWGRVRALADDKGDRIKEAGPSLPVEVVGLQGTPGAGDDFAVVETEARAREIAEYRQAEARKKRSSSGPTSIDEMFSAMKEKQAEEFPVIVRADVQGSVEAIASALGKLGNDDIRCRVVQAAVGAITESDVTLAKASGCPIIGFNVRANPQARAAAESDGIAIQYYSVIYDLVDTVKAGMEGQLGPEIREKTLGLAEIIEVFSAGKHGKAAGCRVLEGFARSHAKARLLRDSVVVFNGTLTSLRRFKDDVEEVKSGIECGMGFENYYDIKAGDQIEIYELEEHERVL